MNETPASDAELLHDSAAISADSLRRAARRRALIAAAIAAIPLWFLWSLVLSLVDLLAGGTVGGPGSPGTPGEAWWKLPGDALITGAFGYALFSIVKSVYKRRLRKRSTELR